MDWTLKRYPAVIGGVKQAYPAIKPGQSFYSRTVVVGNLIFVSAMSPRSYASGKVEVKTPEEQVFATMDNIRLAIEEAGGSLNNVIQTNIIVRNSDDCQQVRAAMFNYYQKNASLLTEEPPIISEVITRPEDPEALVQIDAIAVISGGETGWEMKKYPAYCGGIKQAFPAVNPGQPMFSRSAVVGNIVFLTGANGRSLIDGKVPETFEEQLAIALDKIKLGMEQAGGSMETAIKNLVIFKDIDAHYTTFRRIESEFYQKHSRSLAENPPASSVCMANLSDPEYLVELNYIGIVSKNKTDWGLRKYPAYYGGIKYAYPQVPPGHPLFSRSSVSGKLILCSGAAGLAIGTFKQSSPVLEDQMAVAMGKIKMYMEQAKSSMENIIKMNILIKNLEDLPKLRKAELEFYIMNAPALVGDPPVSTVIESRLHRPETLLEIEAIGIIPE